MLSLAEPICPRCEGPLERIEHHDRTLLWVCKACPINWTPDNLAEAAEEADGPTLSDWRQCYSEELRRGEPGGSSNGDNREEEETAESREQRRVWARTRAEQEDAAQRLCQSVVVERENLDKKTRKRNYRLALDLDAALLDKVTESMGAGTAMQALVGGFFREVLDNSSTKMLG